MVHANISHFIHSMDTSIYAMKNAVNYNILLNESVLYRLEMMNEWLMLNRLLFLIQEAEKLNLVKSRDKLTKVQNCKPSIEYTIITSIKVLVCSLCLTFHVLTNTFTIGSHVILHSLFWIFVLICSRHLIMLQYL